MNKPSFDYPIKEQRNSIGWMLSFILFAMLIVSQLLYSLNPDHELGINKNNIQTPSSLNKKDHFAADYLQLEYTIMLKEFYSRNTALDNQNKQDISNLLDGSISKMIDYKKFNPEADALYIVMRHEQGHKIDPTDFDILEKNKDERYRVIAAIYKAQHLDLAQAKQLNLKLKDNNFFYKLIKIHAYEKAGDKAAREQFLPYEEWMRKGFLAIIYGILILMGLFLWVYYFRKRSEGKFKPLGEPIMVKTDADADRNMVRVSMFLIWFIIAPLSIMALSGYIEKTYLNVIERIIEFTGVLLILQMRIWGQGIQFKKLLGNLKNWKNYVIWGIFASLANIPIVLLFAFIGMSLFKFLPEPSHPLTDLLLNHASPFFIITAFFLASIAAPLIEEVVFRGVLFPTLKKRFKSFIMGATISSLLFAAIHPQGISLWLSLASVGYMSCLLMRQTRSIIPSIIMHATHNALMLFFTLMMF